MNTFLLLLNLLGVAAILLLQLWHTNVITKLREGVGLLEMAWARTTGKPVSPAKAPGKE